MSYALYSVPLGEGHTSRYGKEVFTSARLARAARKRECQRGNRVAIHSGDDHPEQLGFGATLWMEPKGTTALRPMEKKQ